MGGDIFRLSQGSILGLLLVNIFLSDLFFTMIETGFASYAETPYTSGQNIDNVIRTLENNSVRLFKWISNKQIKANQDKCHLFLCNKERVTMKIGKAEIKGSNCENLLGIKIGGKHVFN